MHPFHEGGRVRRTAIGRFLSYGEFDRRVLVLGLPPDELILAPTDEQLRLRCATLDLKCFRIERLPLRWRHRHPGGRFENNCTGTEHLIRLVVPSKRPFGGNSKQPVCPGPAPAWH